MSIFSKLFNSPVTTGFIIGGVVLVIALAIGIPIVVNKLSDDNYIKDNGVVTVGTPTGKIIDTRTVRVRHNSHNWHVEYEYFVNGKRYTALGEKSDNVSDLAQKRADLIGTIDIIYLPDDPTRYYADDFRNIF